MVRIRTATEADAAAIAAIYAPYVEGTVISFEEAAPSAEEMASRIEIALKDHPFLVHEEDGAVRGYAYAGQHRSRAAYRWSCDVTVYAAPDRQRRGVGRALYTELLALLTRQGFHSAFAGIALPNDASVGLHEAMGFQPIGIYREVGFKQGAWRDVGWWRLGLAEGPPKGEPIPFSAL